MTGGYSNREIASALELSEGTVKNHVSTFWANSASTTALAPF
jgi:DNA-binding NarL/FixJ family response regulator